MENRLTARNENNLAYLVNVRPNEQDVESPYPNTLKCIMECFNCLASYEDTNLTPAEIEALKQENQGLKANSMIQEHIIQSGGNPLDKDKIITLIMENSALKAKLQKVERERDAAVQVIYSVPTCTNCIHMDECDEIGGRCEGRGYGSDCHEPRVEPHFKWRGLEDTTCE